MSVLTLLSLICPVAQAQPTTVPELGSLQSPHRSEHAVVVDSRSYSVSAIRDVLFYNPQPGDRRFDESRSEWRPDGSGPPPTPGDWRVIGVRFGFSLNAPQDSMPLPSSLDCNVQFLNQPATTDAPTELTQRIFLEPSTARYGTMRLRFGNRAGEAGPFRVVALPHLWDSSRSAFYPGTPAFEANLANLVESVRPLVRPRNRRRRPPTATSVHDSNVERLSQLLFRVRYSTYAITGITCVRGPFERDPSSVKPAKSR